MHVCTPSSSLHGSCECKKKAKPHDDDNREINAYMENKHDRRGRGDGNF